MQKNNAQLSFEIDDLDFSDQPYPFTGTKDIHAMSNQQFCDVWAHNFHEEIHKIMRLAEKFNVIAMDTEFPGIFVNRSEVDQRYYSEEDCEYMLIRRNVEETRLIQIGLTISDEDGKVPLPVCTWQFNFKFDKDKDKIVDQSYDLLIKAGVRFDKLVNEGIEFALFAEYFAGSNLVLNNKMKWVVFHGSSDFAYLLRLVLGEELPHSIEQFYKTMKSYFPNIYDLKYIIKDIPSLRDVGLAKLSYEIDCCRIGPQHQAGSDSLLTLSCYFKILQQTDLFGPRQFVNCLNVIFGIGIGFMKNSMGSYPSQRDYIDNTSYLQREYHEYANRQYYDPRNAHNHGHQQQQQQYMTHHIPYGMGQLNNNYGNGPLYNYLHQQPAMYNYMYQPNPHDQNKRYQ